MLEARTRIVERFLDLLTHPLVLGSGVRVGGLHRLRAIGATVPLEHDFIRPPGLERETASLQTELADHFERLDRIAERARPAIVRRDQHGDAGRAGLQLEISSGL